MIKQDHGGNVSEVSRIYGLAEDRIIDFSANINPLGYPPGLKDAVMGDFDAILNYPDIDSFDLIEGLSAYHGVSRDSLLVGNGSTEFMYLIPMVFKPKKALIVSPAFSEYEKGLHMVGTDVSYFQTVREQGFALDVMGLCDRLRESFDAVYLCNPANPTGILTSKDDVRRIIDVAEQTKAMVIIDEAFIDFVENESVKAEIDRYASLIIMRSMTKFFGIPGLRIGYLLAAPSCIETIRRSKTPWTVNALVQRAVAKVLDDREYIDTTRRLVQSERDYLKTALRNISGLTVFDGAANFLFVYMEDRCAMRSTTLRDHLVQDGILIRDCSNFHGLNDRYFRVAVKRCDQNEILIKKLREIVT